MRRTSLLITVACILCAGIWYVFAQDNAPPPDFGIETESPSEKPARVPNARSVDAIGDKKLATAQEGSAGPERNAVKHEQGGDDRPRLLITVVDDKTGEPVPNAELVYEDVELKMKSLGGADLAFYEVHNKNRKADAVLDRFGLKTRADAKGQALVPIAARSMYIRGRHENLYGLLHLDPRRDPPEEGWQLKLTKDINFDILVRDTSGNPVANIPVAIRMDHDRERKGRPVTKSTTSHKLGTSAAPDGRFRVTHLQRVIQGYRKSSLRMSRLISTRIVPHIPGLSRKGVEINLEAPPTEALVLTVPALGSIKVLVQDERALPIADQAWIRLIPKGGDTQDRKDYSSRWSASTDRGQHRFTQVPLGRSFEVAVKLRGENSKTQIRGPSSPGQETVETVILGNSRCILTGRATNKDGQALVDTQLSLTYKIDKRSYSAQSKSDSEGRFRMVLENRTLDKTATSIQLVKLKNRWSKGSMSSDEVNTNLLLSRGTHEIGDLQLIEAPLLVSGKLISETDEDLADVGINAEYMRTRTTGGKLVEYWSTSRQYDIERSEDGNFTIHAKSEPTRWRLKIRSKSHTSIDPIEFQPGTRDLRIKLDVGCSLNTTVIVDDFVKQSLLRLALLPTGTLAADKFMPFSETGSGVARPFGSEPGKLRYHWQSVTTGVFDLVVRLNGNPKPVALLPGITLPHTDKAIEIDLRGKVHMFVIRARDETGKVIPFGAAIVTTGFGSRDLEAFQLNKGEAKVLSTSPTIDLIVGSRGFIPSTLLGVSTDTPVVLRRPIRYPVKLRYSGIVKLPEGSSLVATLMEQETTNKSRDARFFRYPGRSRRSLQSYGPRNYRVSMGLKNGVVDLSVSTPGMYKPTLSLRTKSRSSVHITGQNPTHVEVLDQPGEQSFVITIPESSMKSAISKIEK